MALSLKQQLLCLEDDFLSALAQGEHAILAFEHRWVTLLNEVDAASESAAIDPETLSLAHAAAVRCATLADISIETFSSCNTIGSELMDSLDSMMSDLSISDSNASSSSYLFSPPHKSPPPLPRKRSRTSNSETTVRTTSRKRRYEAVESTERDTPRSKRHHAASTSHSAGQSPFSSTCSLPNVLAAHCGIPARAEPFTSLKRKRRLSDADVSCGPAGSKRLFVGPRLHAVSDSYLLNHQYTQTYSDIPDSIPSSASHCTIAAASLPIQPHPIIIPDVDLFKYQSPVLTHTNFEQQPYAEVSNMISPLSELSQLDSFLRSLFDSNAPEENVSTFLVSANNAVEPSNDSVVLRTPGTSLQNPSATPHGSLPSTPSSASTPSFPLTPSVEGRCIDYCAETPCKLEESPLSSFDFMSPQTFFRFESPESLSPTPNGVGSETPSYDWLSNPGCFEPVISLPIPAPIHSPPLGPGSSDNDSWTSLFQSALACDVPFGTPIQGSFEISYNGLILS